MSSYAWSVRGGIALGAIVVLCGCAEGAPANYEDRPRATVTVFVQAPAVTGAAGGAAVVPDELPAGEACALGESELCYCEATGREGARACQPDGRSPLGGYLGACGCP